MLDARRAVRAPASPRAFAAPSRFRRCFLAPGGSSSPGQRTLGLLLQLRLLAAPNDDENDDCDQAWVRQRAATSCDVAINQSVHREAAKPSDRPMMVA